MESVSNEANRGICESLLEISKTYSKNGEQYRAKALNHSAHQLAKVHIVIDKSNINTLKLIPGVGMGTVARVHEYITKGSITIPKKYTNDTLLKSSMNPKNIELWKAMADCAGYYQKNGNYRYMKCIDDALLLIEAADKEICSAADLIGVKGVQKLGDHITRLLDEFFATGEIINNNNKSVKRPISGLELPDDEPVAKKAKTYHPQPQEAVIYNKDNYSIIETPDSWIMIAK